MICGHDLLHIVVHRQGKGVVRRYEVPGIHGLNFVLEASLGGGGIASLRPDPQGETHNLDANIFYILCRYFFTFFVGKAYGQILGDYKLVNLPELDMIKTTV